MSYHFEIKNTLQKNIFLFTQKEIRDIINDKNTFYSQKIKDNKDIPDNIQKIILREINRDKHCIKINQKLFLIPKKIVSVLRITTPLDKPFYIFSNYIMFNMEDKLFYNVSFFIISNKKNIFLSIPINNEENITLLDSLMKKKDYKLTFSENSNSISDYDENGKEFSFFISQRSYHRINNNKIIF